jgi:biotin-dependent carboxylase-like uncharacterized protein
MNALEILDPGLQSLVQDAGRIGFTSIGVPRGGAADVISLRCANELVGNHPDAAAIEMAMLGISALALCDLNICLAGADALAAHVVAADGATRPVPALTPLAVQAGEVLRIGRLTSGLRALLAIAGGIDVPRVLSSASTLVSASMGGIEGRALRRGDVLTVGWDGLSSPRTLRTSPVALGAMLSGILRPPRVRVVAGVHAAALGPAMLAALQAKTFMVENQSNRVGVRLRPERAEASCWSHALGRIASVGMTCGAIEIPPEGSPIILGPDHPTTGGYPVVACIIAADLPALGQLGPGDAVRFELVSNEAARAAFAAQQARLNRELSPS